MMKGFCILSTTLALIAATSGAARAHHVTDFLLTSSEEGGGSLECLYPYEVTVAPVTFSHSENGVSVYTGTDPGFDASDGDDPRYGVLGGPLVPVLRHGTTISVEITQIDEGIVAARLNGQTLAHVGDSVVLGTEGAAPPNGLHHHPEWELILMLPEGEYGEAAISFRVTTDSPHYGPSPSYTLRLSNAHLAPVDYDASKFDKASLACQGTVGTVVGAYTSRVYATLRPCLAALQGLRARTATGKGIAQAEAAAEKVCANAHGKGPDAQTLLGRLAAAKSDALAMIQRKCGGAGSNDFTDDAISAHLGMVECRVFGLVAAGYFAARTDLRKFNARASQGGRPLGDYFPCFLKTAGEEELDPNAR